MTPVRVQYFKLARRRLAQCRRAVQLLMDVQDDEVAAFQLREEFRFLNEALNDFAHYQCGIGLRGSSVSRSRRPGAD